VNLETIGQILDDIVADDKRAANVIHGLRALLKRGDPEHAALDLNEVIRDVARLVTSVRSSATSRSPSSWPPICRACAATGSSCSRWC
jgi:hypothetical protein